MTAYRLTLADPTLSDPTRALLSMRCTSYGAARMISVMPCNRARQAAPASVASDAVNNLATVIRDYRALEPSISLSLISLTWDGRLSMSHAVLRPQVATALSTAFNNALESTLQHLDSTLPEHIARLDIATHFQEVTANPQNFGVTNVTDACLSGDISPLAPSVPTPRALFSGMPLAILPLWPRT